MYDKPLEDLLALEEEQLRNLQTLLRNIIQSRAINTENTLEIYAPKFTITRDFGLLELEKREASILAKQANVLSKILQHPNCPENLTIEITLTGNYTDYPTFDRCYHEDRRARTPLAPIFRALTSGKCIARGLTIKLVGEANFVLQDEMSILVKGLTDGKCPNNLQVIFGPLDDSSALMQALQSTHCPSGLKIEHTADKIYSFEKESWDELDRLCSNGNYDRENIKRNINKIHTSISEKLTREISRLDGRVETVRTDALKTLQNGIDIICQSAKTHIETCDPNTTWEWKNNLRTNLETEINTALESSKFDKKYTSFVKFCKNLLNLVTGLIFPCALIKYATTGSAFYSTVGKSQEAVVETLNISKSI